jgi:hypothetical protein
MYSSAASVESNSYDFSGFSTFSPSGVSSIRMGNLNPVTLEEKYAEIKAKYKIDESFSELEAMTEEELNTLSDKLNKYKAYLIEKRAREI